MTTTRSLASVCLALFLGFRQLQGALNLTRVGSMAYLVLVVEGTFHDSAVPWPYQTIGCLFGFAHADGGEAPTLCRILVKSLS